MSDAAHTTCRYFVSYSGVKLPLKLVNEMQPGDTGNRNTYFCGHYDGDGRLVKVEQVVYGEIGLRHDYRYHDDGSLASATITDEDDEENVLEFAPGDALPA